MKSKKKKPHPLTEHRAHCSLDALPVNSQKAIEEMIVNNKWPNNFKGPRNGKPRYKNIVEYCRQKGCVVSESSIGRFALRIQKTKGDLRPYVLACLIGACTKFVDLQSDLSEATTCPGQTPCADEGRAELEILAEQKLDYIVKAIADLKRLK